MTRKKSKKVAIEPRSGSRERNERAPRGVRAAASGGPRLSNGGLVNGGSANDRTTTNDKKTKQQNGVNGTKPVPMNGNGNGHLGGLQVESLTELESLVAQIKRPHRDGTLNGHETKANGHKRNGHKATGREPKINQATANGQKRVNGIARADAAEAGQKRGSHVARDRQLVERCLLGEVAAWSAIYRQCHETLLLSIRAFLGRPGLDANLVDEIAARTWYAVVRDGFSLLDRFDEKFGCRLTTFLSLLAKNEARLLLRSERRRKTREQAASRPEVQKAKTGSIAVISDEEFMATLSPSERSYCAEVLFAKSEKSSESDYSRGNRWQLRHRIKKKLESYLS